MRQNLVLTTAGFPSTLHAYLTHTRTLSVAAFCTILTRHHVRQDLELKMVGSYHTIGNWNTLKAPKTRLVPGTSDWHYTCAGEHAWDFEQKTLMWAEFGLVCQFCSDADELTQEPRVSRTQSCFVLLPITNGCDVELFLTSG